MSQNLESDVLPIEPSRQPSSSSSFRSSDGYSSLCDESSSTPQVLQAAVDLPGHWGGVGPGPLSERLSQLKLLAKFTFVHFFFFFNLSIAVVYLYVFYF